MAWRDQSFGHRCILRGIEGDCPVYRSVAEDGDVEDGSAGKVAVNIAADEAAGVGGDDFVAVEVGVIEHAVDCDAAALEGLEGQDGMVDRAKHTIGDDSDRQIARGNIVDGEEIVGDRHHQSAGAFDKDDIIARRECGGAAVNGREVNLAAVYARGELCRSRIAENDGRRGHVEVFGKRRDAEKAAVGVDVLGVADIAGLNEFLGCDSQAAVEILTGEPGSAVGLAGVGVDAGDKYRLFHFSCRIIVIVLYVR